MMRKLTFGMVILAAGGIGACFSEKVTGATDTDDIDELCGASPGPAVVQIRGHAFHPAELRVAPGTRVVWANCDEVAHTSTADDRAWDSPVLSPRQSFAHTFAAAGRRPYHCDPHPFMKGVVVVE